MSETCTTCVPVLLAPLIFIVGTREVFNCFFNLNLKKTNGRNWKIRKSNRSIFVIISSITGSLNARSANSINSATSVISALRFSPALHVYQVTDIAAKAEERKIRNDRISDFFRYYFIIIFATSGAAHRRSVAGPLHTYQLPCVSPILSRPKEREDHGWERK